MKNRLAITLALAILTACSSGQPEPQTEIHVEEVTFESTPNSNHNHVAPIDLVVVYDPQLIATFLALSANDYFEKKKQLLRDNPDKFEIFSWEPIPGIFVPPQHVVLSHALPQAGILFANFVTPGDHRIRIGKDTGIKIILETDDVSIIGYPYAPRDWDGWGNPL